MVVNIGEMCVIKKYGKHFGFCINKNCIIGVIQFAE